MTDQTAEAARLMKVAEVVIIELGRQGVLELVANQGFDPIEMAKAVIKAAGSVPAFHDQEPTLPRSR